MVVAPHKRLFTVDEYYRMAQSGILTEDDRVELIEGEIIQMTPIGSRHASVVNRLTRLFSRLIGDEEGFPSVQNPCHVDEFSEPQPDITILKPSSTLYADRHPTPQDVLLLIEVSDSTLHYDLHRKVPLYARSGIPEVWIVDLIHDKVLAFAGPSPSGYSRQREFIRGQEIECETLPDLAIAVVDILGE